MPFYYSEVLVDGEFHLDYKIPVEGFDGLFLLTINIWIFEKGKFTLDK